LIASAAYSKHAGDRSSEFTRASKEEQMRRYLLLVGLCLWLAGCSSEPPAETAKAPPPPPPPAEAGSVTARLPEGQIQRAALSLPSTVGTKVLWKDFVVTDAQGRVRITLLDNSILNVGADSRFEVVRHETRSGQTEIFLTTGRMRLRLAPQQASRRFEIRTDSAVIGVVGTDFFVRATPTQTRVVVYEGFVRLRSADPAVERETLLSAGQTAAVDRGQPPGPARTVTRAVLEESLRDTDVGPPLPAPRFGLPTGAAR
jgi:ferric-dicitrate binding protein FerR (iron transport regulator)